MATVTTFAAMPLDLRFPGTSLSSLQPTFAGPTQIVLALGAEQLVFQGSFFYNATFTALAGGTATGLDYYLNGSLSVRLMVISVPALTVEQYVRANDAVGLTALALSGNDLIQSNLSFPLNDYLLGFNGNDSIFSGAGDDFIDGGPGLDSMNGGAGNDTYIVGEADTITDPAGVDTVQSFIPWTLHCYVNVPATGPVRITARCMKSKRGRSMHYFWTAPCRSVRTHATRRLAEFSGAPN